MGVLTGVCVFRGDGVSGSVTLSQDEAGGPTKIAGTIKGLDAGKHGFHIHEFGDLSQGCSSTGGHFNPMKMAHGAPTASERHFGDLGNIVANEDGVATVSITDSMVTLIGDNSVIGRAFIIHESINAHCLLVNRMSNQASVVVVADDLGKTSHQLSKTTGNAGGRVAGGVIGRGKAA
ncbi:hypothetical protein PBRA_008973 [Plasmodiophora brassicae]|uniref:Superoxide dismutase copper/zinc binding domain-containing protein n=1 Tax=Plasmodiophora brassicae TaxID=37360 RepID=A0A0G4J4T3_PLABS|nr:hypothetical protein PBRA_008973 [Plasmodiophora brassicae]